MVDIRSDWLTCKKCNRRGKYTFDEEKVTYDYNKKVILLKWNLNCKFCNSHMNMENLTESTISQLYLLLLARNLGFD